MVTIHLRGQALQRRLARNIVIDRTNVVNNVGSFGWPSNYITMGITYEYLDFWRPPRRGRRC
jgi:hypothetical protein